MNAYSQELIKKYKKKLPLKIIKDLEKYLPNKISKEKLDEVFKTVQKRYNQAIAQAGECVGVISAESIGEPSTQMTLNTFHFAGVSELNVTVGLPRIIEIFDARKEIKTPMMEIFFKGPYNNINKVKQIAMKIKETKIYDLLKEITTDIFEQSMTLTLNTEILKELSLEATDISSLIRSKVKGVSIKTGETTIEIKSKDESLSKAAKLKEKIKGLKVQGLKGIKQVLPVKRNEECLLLTAGSNLAEILEMKEVDVKRTTCNDMHEIYRVLGVEAARQSIIDEVNRVIDTQGLNINVRHIMLVADTMCSSGLIKGITRYGVVQEKTSVLARASFETPIPHLVAASLIGERDELNSVVENVMINQPVPIGTGMPKLVVKE